METKKVQLNVYIAEVCRDMLQKMAAERMLKDPRRAVSASKMGADIICEYLKGLEVKEKNDEVSHRKKPE